ncbi:hypothetical protein NQL31_007847 [Lotmaria passim]
MASLALLVAVMLMTGTAATATDGVSAVGKNNRQAGYSSTGHLGRTRQQFPLAGFVDASLSGSEWATSPLSSSASASSAASANTNRGAFCGSWPRDQCALLYASNVAALLVLVSAVGAWWLLRWWCCGTEGLHGWRRVDSAGADNDSDARVAGGVAEHERLLRAPTQGPDDMAHVVEEPEEGGSAPAGEGNYQVNGRMARCVHRLNLHGTRLWTVLRMTPVGLFYGLSQPSSPTQPPSAAATRRPSSAPPGDATAWASDDDDDWPVRRDATPVSAADRRPFLRGVVSVVTATADSSESSNDSVRHSEDGGAAHEADHFSCERERLNVETVERECAVGRSTAAIRPPNSLVTQHILPQFIDYNAASITRYDGEEGGFRDSTDSDSQQMNRRGIKTARTSTSSLTASANSSAHTPLFPAREALVPRIDSVDSISRYNADERDASEHNSSAARVGFPHVETAIFDATANACVMTRPHLLQVDLNSLNDIFEPDHFPPPPATLSTSEAPASSIASQLSALDCYIPPPANSGTATPASMRGSGACLPLPVATVAPSCFAALPVSSSLNSDLDMAGEEEVVVFDTTQRSSSYVPSTQPQPQQTHSPLTPPPPPPPAAAEKSVKARRKRSVAYYSEPWQPILVPQSTPQLVAAAAATALPTTAAAAVRSRDSSLPPRSPMSQLSGALEDELDDLMIGDDESAQSNQTGESGHIFSGSSTSTSRTVTPAAENEVESAVGTSTMFCAAAMACGGGGCGSGSHRGTVGFVTVTPPASASILLRPEAPPVALFARTAGAGGALLARCSTDTTGGSSTWPSCSVGRRPLHLSLEERTLLLKSRKWLFPLIDGADEIESCEVGEGKESHESDEVNAKPVDA